MLRFWKFDKYILVFLLGLSIGVLGGIKWQSMEIMNCPDAEKQLARCDQAFQDLKTISQWRDLYEINQGILLKVMDDEIMECYNETKLVDINE